MSNLKGSQYPQRSSCIQDHMLCRNFEPREIVAGIAAESFVWIFAGWDFVLSGIRFWAIYYLVGGFNPSEKY